MHNENIVSDLVFKQLQVEQEENNWCFDCQQQSPQWASVNQGIFICMNCAALHRSLGVNISFVRSLSMDAWSEKQLRLMALGGNKKLKNFLQMYDLNEEPVQMKYSTQAGHYYRILLRSESENIPVSEQEPQYDVARTQVPAEKGRSPDEIMQNNG